MNLSKRLRPGSECAPWVIEEVKRLEADRTNQERRADDCFSEVERLRSIIRKALDEAQSYDGTITGMVRILCGGRE